MQKGRIKEVEKIWLTTKDACTYLGVGKDFMQRMRNSGTLHFYKIGKMIWYKVSDLDRLIERNRVV